MLMICNRAGKTSSCTVCPEAKPHEPLPRNLPEGAKVVKEWCVGDNGNLAEVRLIPA